MRKESERVAILLITRAEQLQYDLVAPLSNYRYQLSDRRRGKTYTALCLIDTWAWYEQQLPQANTSATLLVVEKHNAIVNLPVLSMTDNTLYRPGALPELRKTAASARRTADQKKLLLSMMLTGHKDARRELETMAERTRRWYTAEKHKLLAPRRGRPWEAIERKDSYEATLRAMQ